MANLVPFHLLRWIEENRETFKPPAGSRLVWQDGDFSVLIIAGPNARDDYHIDPGDEIFYQLKGDIAVGIIDEQGKRREVAVREGELMVLPAGVPHQPRRGRGTYGLVVERPRRPEEIDSFVWHCEKCNAVLHRVDLKGHELAQGITTLNELTSRQDFRTCQQCGHTTPVPKA